MSLHLVRSGTKVCVVVILQMSIGDPEYDSVKNKAHVQSDRKSGLGMQDETGNKQQRERTVATGISIETWKCPRNSRRSD